MTKDSEVTSSKDSIMISFRIPSDLKKSIEVLAAAQDRTVSRQIVHILRRYIDQQNASAE